MKYCLPIALFLCLLAASVHAESLMSFHLDQLVRLEADEMRGSYSDEQFEAIGAATLRQENLTLHADSIWFDKRTNEAGAKGKVTLLEKSGTLVGDDLLLNFTSGRARLTHARAHLAEEGFNLSGEVIERLDESHYRVTSGDFTACTATPPAWKFGASSVDVEVGGYARAKHMVFYLRDIPVFYLPYFLYPVKTERESGLLIPHIGLSDKRGFETYLSYYQVLGRNMDATLLLDTYSSAGLGKGLEYRYILGEENVGETFLYHVSRIDEKKDVFAGRWQHRGILPGEINLRADLEYVSDRSYLKDFTVDARDYNRELVESYLYLSRAWDKTDLSVQGEYLSNLSTSTDAYPLSQLPAVHLALLPQRVAATPLYLRLDLQGNHLQQGQNTVGETLLLRPAARLALSPFTGVSLDLEAGYRSMLSKTSEDSGDVGFFDFSSRLGTRWQRIFTNEEEGYALRHDIEPEVTFLHIADGGQATFRELIPENSFLPTDHITFGLTNRLVTRTIDAEGSALRRERLWLRLSSGYAFSTDTTAPETLLPLRSEVLLSVAEWLSLRSDASYGLEAGEHRWNSVVSGIQLKDRRRDELSIDYYYQDNNAANYLSGKLFTPITDKISLANEIRYSVESSEFLEHRAAVEYRGQCWSVIFSYRDRLDDQEYLVNFALAGLMEQGLR
ncbi:MAG: LPS-assembly protein LptD [Desulfuromonadales bacterium]|nr:LPS-assembly protein LptD [Desulfuromonadales bacterium]